VKQPSLPFDHQPDRALGSALRASLAPDGEAAFVARVRAALHRPARSATWDVLAGWSRAGIAAAAAAALLAGFLVGRAMQAPAPVEEVAVAGEGATALIAAPRAPDASVVFTALENRER